jgi:hypothetical protein
MAQRGTSKRYSVEHEDHIANVYGGKRSRSSGAAVTDAGDVRTSDGQLIECKMTGNVLKPSQLPTFVQHLEKVALEAWAENKIPALALRYYQPESKLAARDGWVDLIVRPVTDDLEYRDH